MGDPHWFCSLLQHAPHAVTRPYAVPAVWLRNVCAHGEIWGSIDTSSRPSDTCLPGRRPGLHPLAQDRELADMIGIVVGHRQNLAQDRLALAVRDCRMKVP